MRGLFLGAVLGVALVAGQHEAMHAAVTPDLKAEAPAPAPAPDWRGRGWGDLVCSLMGYWPSWCPRPIKEVTPPDPGPTPTCNPATQSCPQ